MKPRFSILIVNHKTLHHTKTCLESIRQHSANDSHELIVVDNDSADESLVYLRAQNDITLIERKEGLHYGPRDHGEALDIGLQYASGEYVVILDSDVVILQPNWLRILAEVLCKEGAVLIGPSFYRNFIHACVLMIEKQVLDVHDLGFRAFTRFHEYFDTAEYITRRLMQLGYKIISLASWVPHTDRGDEQEYIDGRNTKQWGENWFPLVAKHGVLISGVGFHGFFGTFIQQWDINGLKNDAIKRVPSLEQYKAELLSEPVSYRFLNDPRSKPKVYYDGAVWITRATVHTGLHLISSIKQKLFGHN